MKSSKGIGCLVLIGLFFACVLIGNLNKGASGTPTPQPPAQAQLPLAMPTATPAQSVPTPTATAAGTPHPSATPTPFAVVVANTGGDGVYIRRTTAAADKMRVWPDSTQMLVVGPDQQAEGKTWRNVRDPAGNVGWIPAEYLAVPTATPPPTPTIDRSQYKLELIASNGYTEYGYAKVEGQVKNISSTSLRNVEVVVEWYTADGEFVKKDSSLIDYNPVLPGQTSPFDTITTDNPAMKKFRITFKELMGGTIPTLDSRKR